MDCVSVEFIRNLVKIKIIQPNYLGDLLGVYYDSNTFLNLLFRIVQLKNWCYWIHIIVSKIGNRIYKQFLNEILY